MVSSEGKFSHLSSEEKSNLAVQGRDALTRLREKQKTGGSRDRLEELREEHRKEIEKIIASGEEEKSRELSLLSEELTKHYKYHIEQLEQKLQLLRETDSGTGIGPDENELSRIKSHIEHTASIQVQQYYQQCSEEMEKMEDEINLLNQEKENAIEDAAVLRKELQISRQELEHLVQRGSDSSSREREWEMERVTFGQKLQEADTKVGGLERLLEERLKACELLTAERDETREILGNREREKIALSRHFTQQVGQLEQEKTELCETVKIRNNELLGLNAELSELRELLERQEGEKNQLAQEFLRNRNTTQECKDLKAELARLETEKQGLITELSAERSAVERQRGDMESMTSQLRQESTGLVARLESTSKLNGELYNRTSELDNELAAVLLKYSTLERQMQTCQGETGRERERGGKRVRELEQLLVTAGEDKSELSLMLSEAESDKSEVNIINVSIRAELDTALREAQEKQTENENLMSELDRLNKSYLAIQTERNSLNMRVNEYANQPQDRDNSKSAEYQLSTQNNMETQLSTITSEMSTGADRYLGIIREEMVFLRAREDGADRIFAIARECKQKLQADTVALSKKIATRS